MVTTLQALKAAAEETRLRLLALLETGEASVGELVIVLQQSQPRVSRHLKLLVAAGLVENFRDSHHVYYRLAEGASRSLLDEVLAGVRGDAGIEADLVRLSEVRHEREKDAYRRIDPKAAPTARAARADDETIFAAIDDALADEDIGDLLDVRTGTGRLLTHLAPKAATATGVDKSQAMRLLARTKVQQAGLAKCTLRNVDGKSLPFSPDSFDTVLLNESLTRADDLRSALAEAVRVLRVGGRLLILDWIQPTSLQNRADSEGLAENQLRTLLAENGLQITERSWLPGKAPDYALFIAAPARGQNIKQTSGMSA